MCYCGDVTGRLLQPAAADGDLPVAIGVSLPAPALLADAEVALGNIRVASYIDQPGLVLAGGDGTINAARNHIWAEPLQVSLRRYLATQLGCSGSDIAANAMPSTSTRVDVSVDQLHGNGKGAAVLVAYWEITADGASRAFRFSEQQALAGFDGYDALVRPKRPCCSVWLTLSPPRAACRRVVRLALPGPGVRGELAQASRRPRVAPSLSVSAESRFSFPAWRAGRHSLQSPVNFQPLDPVAG